MRSRMCRRISFLLSFLLIGLAPARGQFPHLRFEHITTANGLPHSSTYCILMDRQGFLWFGTNEGISRYDGRRFATVATAVDGSLLQGQNLIYDFIESRNGTIWCATPGGGVLYYDPVKDAVARLTARANGLSSNLVYAVCEDSKGTLWVGSNGGLDTLDCVSNQFHHIEQTAAKERLPVDMKITELGEWPRASGVLWVGTWGQGLFRFDREHGQWLAWRERPLNPDGFEDGHVRTVFMPQRRSGELWVGTEKGGLYCLHLDSGKLKRVPLSLQSNPGTFPPGISHINEDSAGILLVSTLGAGLYLLDPASGRSNQFSARPRDPSSISHNDVRTSWIDPNGSLWLGTRNGIDKADPIRRLFSTYTHDPDDRRRGLSHNMVYGMCEDRRGVLWVCTSGGGLNRFDRNSGRWTVFTHDPHNAGSLATNELTSVYEDRSGSVWVGGVGGWLHRLRQSTGTFDRWQIVSGPSELPSGNIFCIYQDGKGTFWLGTIQGLIRFDPLTGAGTLVASDGLPPEQSLTSDVFSILEDRSGGFWTATLHGGIHRVNRSTGTYETFGHKEGDSGSLSISSASTLLEDREGKLWIGTRGGGVNRFIPAAKRFEAFTKRDGLSNDVVYDLLEDHRGRIWISTGRGLTAFEPKTGEFSRFDATDGLPANEFNGPSAVRCADGTLGFGGVNGFTLFRPDTLFRNTHIPPVVMTAIELDGERFVGEQATSYLQTVTVPSPDHVLSFEFAALDYRRPERNTYAFQLEGIDKDWAQTGLRRYVAYSHLPPGAYVFRAKGANDSGVWSTRDLAITVVIEPAWWQALWFRIPGLVLVVSLIVFVYRRRISRLRADKLAQQEFSRKLIESQEAERKRLAAELHDGLGQDLLVARNELQQFLEGQHESRDDLARAEGLVHGSIQTLREISSNLHPHHLDRLGFCAAIEAMMDAVGHSSGLTSECACDDVDGLMPKELEIHVYRVIQEAVSNVVHHAEATKVTVLVRRHPKMIEVTVTDNGHGFVHKVGWAKPPLHTHLKRRLGFGLSSMEERARIIGGTLTISSSPGSGTTVGLTCPYS